MTNEQEFVAAVRAAGGPICDDCVTAAVGWSRRQQANQVGRRLKAEGSIARSEGSCLRCGKAKIVNDLGSVVRQPRSAPLAPPPSGRPWYWEGNVQSAIANHLAATGCRLLRVADTASKERGVDIIAERNGKELWVTVKGYPEGTAKTNASTQSRHWFSHAMFDVVRYRTEKSDIEIGVGLPEGFTSYRNLTQGVSWLRRTAPFTFLWVSEGGNVREE